MDRSGLSKQLKKERDWSGENTEYLQMVQRKLLQAVKDARSKLEPAKLGIGTGRSWANINRWSLDADGKINLGKNPLGPVDRQINIIQLDRPDGSPIALITNYPLHGTVLGYYNNYGIGNTLISSDAPGVVSQYVEEKIGAPMLFIQRAAGNIAQIYTTEIDHRRGRLTEFKVLVGDKILEANRTITATTGDIQLRIGKRLMIETPLKEGLTWPDKLKDYCRTTRTGTNLIRFPVSFLCNNDDILIWSAPCKLFCEIAMNIRDASPFPHTFYFGYANGTFGYVLSLAGVKIPGHVQGKAFLGTQEDTPRQYVYGIRDRLDERYDIVRSVRDKHYKYYRNDMPHLPHWPWLEYMEMLDTSKEWRRLQAEGKLEGAHAFFTALTKPVEELYDIRKDPHELQNIADLPQYADVLKWMRNIHLQWVKDTVDLGLLPEQDIQDRAKNSSEYEMARSGKYPIGRILETALLIDQGDKVLPKLIQSLKDEDSAVRFWAAIGLANLGLKAKSAAKPLIATLSDPSPEVRIAVAEALCHMDCESDALPILVKHLNCEHLWIRVYAANVLDRIVEKARPVLKSMKRAVRREYPGVKENIMFVWTLEHAIRHLENR